MGNRAEAAQDVTDAVTGTVSDFSQGTTGQPDGLLASGESPDQPGEHRGHPGCKVLDPGRLIVWYQAKHVCQFRCRRTLSALALSHPETLALVARQIPIRSLGDQ